MSEALKLMHDIKKQLLANLNDLEGIREELEEKKVKKR